MLRAIGLILAITATTLLSGDVRAQEAEDPCANAGGEEAACRREIMLRERGEQREAQAQSERREQEQAEVELREREAQQARRQEEIRERSAAEAESRRQEEIRERNAAEAEARRQEERERRAAEAEARAEETRRRELEARRREQDEQRARAAAQPPANSTQGAPGTIQIPPPPATLPPLDMRTAGSTPPTINTRGQVEQAFRRRDLRETGPTLEDAARRHQWGVMCVRQDEQLQRDIARLALGARYGPAGIAAASRLNDIEDIFHANRDIAAGRYQDAALAYVNVTLGEFVDAYTGGAAGAPLAVAEAATAVGTLYVYGYLTACNGQFDQPPPPTVITPSTPMSVPLEVNGFEQSLRASAAPFDHRFSLTGSGLSTVTEIQWSWSGPTEGTVTWRRGDSNWSRFEPASDGRSARIRPVLIAAGDPAGRYRWTVTFISRDQRQTRAFEVSYTPVASEPPNMNVALEVSGFEQSIPADRAPHSHRFSLTGQALDRVTEIRWSWTGPNEGSTTWRRGDRNWHLFEPSPDGRRAEVRPVVVAANDPVGAYRWTVTLIAGDARVTKRFDVHYQPAGRPSTPAPPSTPPAPRATELPGIPRNLAPGERRAPGPVASRVSVRLSWDTVAGATEYDFGVRDMITNRLVVDSRASRTSFSAELQPGRSYRWNVRACNASGCSAFTEPLYFQTPTR